MSKAPSEATQIRTLKRQLLDTEKCLGAIRTEASNYRTRATKAEQELAEWKQRFDLLLSRTPEQKATP